MSLSRADRAVIATGGAVEGAVRAAARGIGWVIAVAVACVVLALIAVGSKAERLISWGGRGPMTMLEPDRFVATQRVLESMARQVIRVDLDAFLFHAERVEATGGIVAPAACRGADVGRLVALARAAREFRSELHRKGILVAKARARAGKRR